MIVERWWLEFEQSALPKGAPAIQREEMRKAFYSGVYSFVMNASNNLDLGKGRARENDSWLKEIFDELRTFAAERLK